MMGLVKLKYHSNPTAKVVNYEEIMTKLTVKIMLTEKQIIDFAIKETDENCRSIIECACKPIRREKGRALYKYNINDPDKIMLKDVDKSVTYLRSRGTDLPFKMSEKGGFVWFDRKKE